MRKVLAICVFLLSLPLGAQTTLGRIQFLLQSSQGQAISGASINVFTQSACGVPATGTLASIFSDAAGTQPINQSSFFTDGFGQNFAYAAQGCVTIVYNSPFTGQVTLPDQNVVAGSSITAKAAGTERQIQNNTGGLIGASTATADASGNIVSPATITDVVPGVFNPALPETYIKSQVGGIDVDALFRDIDGQNNDTAAFKGGVSNKNFPSAIPFQITGTAGYVEQWAQNQSAAVAVNADARCHWYKDRCWGYLNDVRSYAQHMSLIGHENDMNASNAFDGVIAFLGISNPIVGMPPTAHPYTPYPGMGTNFYTQMNDSNTPFANAFYTAPGSAATALRISPSCLNAQLTPNIVGGQIQSLNVVSGGLLNGDTSFTITITDSGGGTGAVAGAQNLYNGKLYPDSYTPTVSITAATNTVPTVLTVSDSSKVVGLTFADVQSPTDGDPYARLSYVTAVNGANLTLDNTIAPGQVYAGGDYLLLPNRGAQTMSMSNMGSGYTNATVVTATTQCSSPPILMGGIDINGSQHNVAMAVDPSGNFSLTGNVNFVTNPFTSVAHPIMSQILDSNLSATSSNSVLNIVGGSANEFGLIFAYPGSGGGTLKIDMRGNITANTISLAGLAGTNLPLCGTLTNPYNAYRCSNTDIAAAMGLTLPTPAGSALFGMTVASGTAALGTGAISSATCATAVTVAATGVATTDVIGFNFNGDPTGLTGYVPSTSGTLNIYAYPTSGNVNFKVCNNTSGSITPSAATLNWRVAR